MTSYIPQYIWIYLSISWPQRRILLRTSKLCALILLNLSLRARYFYLSFSFATTSGSCFHFFSECWYASFGVIGFERDVEAGTKNLTELFYLSAGLAVFGTLGVGVGVCTLVGYDVFDGLGGILMEFLFSLLAPWPLSLGLQRTLF